MNHERTTPENIQDLRPTEVFVFGSNLINKPKTVAGAALTARRWGSGRAHATGREGMTYAIPTMDWNMQRMTPGWVGEYVADFIKYAEQHPGLTFLVTAVGTGLAGNTVEDIAPLFQGALEVNNIRLPDSFWKVLQSDNKERTK